MPELAQFHNCPSSTATDGRSSWSSDVARVNDSRVVTQVGSYLSTLQQCMDGETAEHQGSILSCMPCCAKMENAAADLESGSQPVQKQHISNTAAEPISCTIPSGTLCSAQTGARQQDRHTAAESLSCGSRCRISPSGKVAGSPHVVQRRGRTQSEEFNTRRGNEENSSNNVLSNI